MSAIDTSRPDIVAFMAKASAALGQDLPQPKDVFAFGGGASNPALSTELLGKAIRGEKSATTSWPVPNPMYWSVGDLSVILDGEGKPGAVMKTTEFVKCKFRDVAVDFGEAEGEGPYEEYRKGHFWFYGLKEQKAAAWKMGEEFEFGDDSWVLCERFEVIYPKPEVGTGEEDGNGDDIGEGKDSKDDEANKE
ncbi:PUA-like domain-containing protein [Rhypophila decipiens]|uniref:PUA-like domain-containing protein n=1 Tax=Rhypophila decipiens TaxID=261697 RepID=A0AAN6Y309_9PEZI|nr:PUA-like domain-containing protein [Rhypophila decipiens]